MCVVAGSIQICSSAVYQAATILRQSTTWIQIPDAGHIVKKAFFSEISELEGLDKKNSSVRQLIIRTSDQLQAGELSLIEVTLTEKKAAKARLDIVRKKRRERHERRNGPYKPNSQNPLIFFSK